MRTFTALFLVAVISGVAAAARAQEKIAIPSRTPALMAEYLHGGGPAVTVTGYLYLPAHASGPVPAMILKHGSGGLESAAGDNIRKWARTLAGWGVAAFIVDSFGPRGISSTGSDQAQLRTWADLTDTFEALKVLADDPRIDKSRIGVVGWSRGGGVVMETALESARRAVLGADGPRFAAHVVFYGPADTQYRDTATDHAPMLFFHGEADDYVPVGPTREFADWIQTMGNPVTFISYPGAYHDFDVEGGVNGFARTVETGRNCDVVIDLSTGHVVRMNHQPASDVTVQQFGAYFKGCIARGADLAPNAAARADAVEKLHAFLRSVFGLTN